MLPEDEKNTRGFTPWARLTRWPLLVTLAVLGLGLLVSAFTLAAPLTAALSGDSGPALATCKVPRFDATVRIGPDRGLSLRGALYLQADASGRLRVLLQRPAQPALHGSGQVLNRIISLFIHLGPGRDVFGSGTLEHDFRTCTGGLGGTFAGPIRADIGDWGCLCCPCYIRTISPTLTMRLELPHLALPRDQLEMHGQLQQIAARPSGGRTG